MFRVNKKHQNNINDVDLVLIVLNFGQILHIVGLELEIFFVNMNLMLQGLFIMVNYLVSVMSFSVVDMTSVVDLLY